MGDWIQLETAAGPVRAWRASPRAPARGAVVVLQEIFGVNPHIRSVADGFADEGYLALAPALFDPVEAGVELGYDQAGTERGVALRNAVGFDRAVKVVDAAATLLNCGLKHSLQVSVATRHAVADDCDACACRDRPRMPE